MRRAQAYQTVGSLIVLSTLIGSQIVAFLLAMNPASQTLWYLDRTYFALFGVSNQTWLLAPDFVYIGLLASMLAALAFLWRWRLLNAVISHLCILVAWLMFPSQGPLLVTAGQALHNVAWSAAHRPSYGVLLIALSGAFVSVLLSHLDYWRSIREQAA